MNRRPRMVLVLFFLVLAPAHRLMGQEKTTYPALGTIERLDPRLDAVLAGDARVERIAEGFEWSEGPVWVKDGGFLLFSDVPKNTVYKWTEARGIEIFLRPSGYTAGASRGGEPGSNGLTLDADGQLVLMQHGDRRVARLGKDSQFVAIADRYEGKRLNSPNDGVYNAQGDFFFTDPPYGLLKQNADAAKEIPFNGVYRATKDGKVTLLTKQLSYPNGIAFSPDEKILYVANSDPKRAVWMAFGVGEDGTLDEGKIFFDATPMVGKRPGLPDGMKVDRDGHLFASGPGGILIFAPDGTHLGTLATGQATANCGWGEDGSTLFVTTDMFLGRVRTKTKGAGR